jgi:SepF-like predicted cell division protein (DUF552 family)
MRQDMPAFGLFNKQKKQDISEQSVANIPNVPFEQTAKTIQEAQVEEKLSEETQYVPSENQSIIMPSSDITAIVKPMEPTSSVITAEWTTYLKAIPLRDLSDLEDIKAEIQNGNILILRITPLASKSVEYVKSAVNELYAFTESIGGDIARLGEERVVICQKNIRIWREKMPVKNELLPTTVA